MEVEQITLPDGKLPDRKLKVPNAVEEEKAEEEQEEEEKKKIQREHLVK